MSEQKRFCDCDHPDCTQCKTDAYFNKRIKALESNTEELKRILLRPSYPAYCLQLHHGDLHIQQLFHDYQKDAVGEMAKLMLHKVEQAIKNKG